MTAMWVATMRDRWFFAEETPDGVLLHLDTISDSPVRMRSLYTAAKWCMAEVGRRGEMSGRRFWGVESDEWCPGCGMGKGAFKTSLTFRQASDAMRGQVYAGHPHVMVHRSERLVGRYMAVQRKLAWEAHCAECRGWKDD